MSAMFVLAAHGAGHLARLAATLAPPSHAPSHAKPPDTVRPPIRKAAMSVPQTRPEGAVTLAQGWWGGGYSYEPRGRRQSRDWWGDDDDDDEPAPYLARSAGTYRTLCVRLCDGFYWPMSYATTPEHFGRDQRKCESSCGSPVRLYTYRNPGGELEDMEDLSGHPYSRLKTAFLYRTEYNESCKCKSDPWEQASLDRHRMYALEERKRKGDKIAARELDALRAHMDDTRKTAGKAPVPAPVDTIAAAPDGAANEPQGSEAAPPTGRPQRRGDSNERMSLGGRSSSPARPDAPPTRFWRNSADNAP